MGIEREIVEKIQSAGFTIVRIDDVNKRKSLTAIIENSKISI
jgi:Holliday junction resolvase